VSHSLTGHFSVEDSARTIRNYRYAAERTMRILGGWIALTPELPAKLVMGRQVWDNAQHADALGRRLPELRAQAQVSEPGSEAFARFMDAVEEPEAPGQTVERLVGIYRVVKPHLLATYAAHMAQANAVYEPPTRRILACCIEDERRHIASGEAVLRHLLKTPALRERARAWQQRLDDLLAASGGVTGQGLSSSAWRDEAPPSVPEDARELIRLERAGAGWAMPEGLEAALRRFGDALVAGDVEGVRGSLLAGHLWTDDLAGRLRGAPPRAHRLTAFSRIGQHRLVKLRLEGATGSTTLMTRWVSAPDGWRAAVVEIAATDAAPPA